MASREEIENALKDKHNQGNWHWLAWHFNNNSLPYQLLVNALIDCETCMEESGLKIASDIGNLAGSERDKAHYDQILQRFAEILIIRKIASPGSLSHLTWELEKPGPGSDKQIDLVGANENIELGIEIKAPKFTDLSELRTRGSQIVNRMPDGAQLAENLDATLPRDNSVKDFLISANAKFESFKSTRPDFTGVLVIVWDDYIHEAITWLKGEQGLLTDRSFYRDEGDTAVKFHNIDAVVVVRHLMYFSASLGTQDPYIGNPKMFDIGGGEGLPNVIFPLTDNVPDDLFALYKELHSFHHEDPELLRAADYNPLDLITWINND